MTDLEYDRVRELLKHFVIHPNLEIWGDGEKKPAAWKEMPGICISTTWTFERRRLDSCLDLYIFKLFAKS